MRRRDFFGTLLAAPPALSFAVAQVVERLGYVSDAPMAKPGQIVLVLRAPV